MRDKNFGIRRLMGVDFSMTGRISDSVMRRMIESQHAAQYGLRLLRPVIEKSTPIKCLIPKFLSRMKPSFFKTLKGLVHAAFVFR